MEQLQFPISMDIAQARAAVKALAAELHNLTNVTIQVGKQQSEAQNNSAREAAAAHQKAFKAITAASQQSFKQQAAIRREADGLQRESAREAAVLARQAAREQTEAGREAAREKAAAAKETARVAKEAAREAADAERQAAKVAKDAAKEQRASDAAYVRAKKQEANARAAIARDLAKEETKAAQQTGSVITGLMGVSAAMIGFQSASQFMSSIVGHFDKLKTDAYAAAEDVMRMRGAIRELAALRGELGQTGGTLSHVLGISALTLQTPEEAKQMLESGLGIGELAIGDEGNISKAEFEKAMVAAGKMQTLEGGPADAYGKMMGQLALTSKKGTTGADLQGQLIKMFNIQQPGGFKNFGQAAEQYSKIQPLIQSGVLSPEDAMSLLSTMSVASPEEASTMVEQFTRATMAGRLRQKGMKVPEGVEFQKSADYMRSIGADKLINPKEIGKRIAADIKEKEAAAQKEGRQFSTYDYLKTHGFVNEQDQNTVMLVAGLRNRNQLQKIEEAQNAPVKRGAMGEIDRRWLEKTRDDPYYKDRATIIAEQLADAKQGVENEALRTSRRAAFARLKQEGKISGSFKEWEAVEGNWQEKAKQDLNPFAPNYHSQVDLMSDQYLEMERRRLGIARPKLQPGAEGYRRDLANSVRDNGGDIALGVMEDLKEAAKDFREAAREQKALNRKEQPPTPLSTAKPKGRM